jgi:hypothetical protein
VPIEAATAESLSTVMPQSIEIVEAFTRWDDLDDRAGIDGLELHVRPLTAAGDPTQAAGTILIELYEFRPASGLSKGERKEMWRIPLLTEADQVQRWNRATQMYDFRLELGADSQRMSGGEKYVLMVTHHSPLGVHRSDEMILQVPLAGGDALSERR